MAVRAGLQGLTRGQKRQPQQRARSTLPRCSSGSQESSTGSTRPLALTRRCGRARSRVCAVALAAYKQGVPGGDDDEPWTTPT